MSELIFKKYPRGVKDGDDKCPICMDKYNNNDIIAIASCCKNSFHMDCLKEAFKHNIDCPLCRNKFKLNINNLEEVFQYKPSGTDVLSDFVKKFFVFNTKQTTNHQPNISVPETTPVEQPISIMDFLDQHPELEEEHKKVLELSQNNNEYQSEIDNSFQIIQEPIITQTYQEPINETNNNEFYYIDNDEQYLKAIQLSQQIEEQEKSFMNDIKMATQRSMQKHSENMVNQISIATHDSDIAYKIQLEELTKNCIHNSSNWESVYYQHEHKPLSNLNNTWEHNIHFKHPSFGHEVIDDKIKNTTRKTNNKEEYINFDNKDDTDHYQSEIQKMIAKRKNYGKRLPKLEISNNLNTTFKTIPV